MSPPPTSIDDTDITSATIDGQDVEEITVDGDVVFSSQTLPVRFSDLVGWWPFDPAQYGGSVLDDVTAIIGGSGDDTAFDGTGFNSPTHQTSGGADDINAGASSGFMDLNGANDYIEFADSSGSFPDITTFSGITIMAWFNLTGGSASQIFGNYNATSGTNRWISIIFTQSQLQLGHDDGTENIIRRTVPFNTWIHAAITHDLNGNFAYYVDGTQEDSGNSGISDIEQGNEFYAGQLSDSDDNLDGSVDDCRIYDQVLSASEINQIYQNTDPN